MDGTCSSYLASTVDGWTGVLTAPLFSGIQTTGLQAYSLKDTYCKLFLHPLRSKNVVF